MSWQCTAAAKASSLLGCMRQSIASRPREVMLSLWGEITTNRGVGADIQVLSKMPTDGFASPLTVAGWIRLLIFITCIGLCLAEICSQADGMAKFSSASTANSLQDTFAKDRRVESHNFLWTGFYFFFFHLVDVASCWSLPQRVEVFSFVSQLGHLTALLTTAQLFLSWV